MNRIFKRVEEVNVKKDVLDKAALLVSHPFDFKSQ